MVKNQVSQPERVAAFDFLAQEGFENFVIDRGKIFFDVAFEDVVKRAGKILRPFDRMVLSLTGTIGIKIGDKGTFKNRFQNIAQSMMDHTVAKGGSGNHAGILIQRLIDVLRVEK